MAASTTHSSSRRRCRRSVLHVDADAPSLKMPSEYQLNTASAEDDCVAIVFASSHQRQNVVEAVRDTKFCSDTGAYAFASVGDLMTGIAFVSMLSNESWLASAISASRTSVAVACAPASRRTRPK